MPHAHNWSPTILRARRSPRGRIERVVMRAWGYPYPGFSHVVDHSCGEHCRHSAATCSGLDGEVGCAGRRQTGTPTSREVHLAQDQSRVVHAEGDEQLSAAADRSVPGRRAGSVPWRSSCGVRGGSGAQELLDVRAFNHPLARSAAVFACQICSMDSTSMTSISILSGSVGTRRRDPTRVCCVTDAQSSSRRPVRSVHQ